jgi:hypothetical protein
VRRSAQYDFDIESRGGLFMFIVFGALERLRIGSITQRLFRSDADLWKTIVLTASVLMPLAVRAISPGTRPCVGEIERLEALEKV